MNKSELVNAIAESTGLTKKDSELAVNAFVETIKETLSQGESVQLIGFGTFEVRDRAARIGRNPQSGLPLEIPASKAVGFKAGKALKDAVRNS